MGLILGSGEPKPQYPYDMWYGVQGDFTSSDYKLTRVGNLDLHRTLPIQNKLRRFVENPDGSVKYYLHQNDSRKKDGGAPAIIDSTDGNVKLEIPEFYFRLELTGTQWLLAVSEFPLPGFVKLERKTISPWYATIDLVNNKSVCGSFIVWDGDEIARDENGYIILTDNAPNFRGGYGNSEAPKDGTHNSQLGMARTGVNADYFKQRCRNGEHVGSYRAFNEIALLQRIEYASLHCQDTYSETLTPEGFKQSGLGYGPTVIRSEWTTWGENRPFAPNGITAILGNNTGRVPYTIKGWPGGDKTVEITSYRGFEAPFQYLWLLPEDIIISHTPDTENGPGKSIAYLCEDPSKFTIVGSTGPIPDGYNSIAELPRASGYILTLNLHGKGYSFPKAIGGSYNKGACDYFYHPGITSDGLWAGWLGGYAGHEAHGGFGYLSTNARLSLTHTVGGCRLCRF